MGHALLVEKQDLVADALTFTIVRACPDLAVTGCRSCRSALRLVDADGRIDLVIVDLSTPESEELDLIRALRCRDPSIPVIVIGTFEEPRLIRALVLAGAAGFVSKRAPGAEFIAAIRTVLSGGRVFPPPALIGEGRGHCVRDRAFVRLAATGGARRARPSERQRQVLHLIADGRTNRQISESIGLTEASVRHHVNVLFRLLGVRNRTACVRAAHREGLLERRVRSSRSEERVSAA